MGKPVCLTEINSFKPEIPPSWMSVHCDIAAWHLFLNPQDSDIYGCEFFPVAFVEEMEASIDEQWCREKNSGEETELIFDSAH